MARSSTTLLVILICGNIHNSLNQPLLEKASMEELMRGIMKRHEEEVVDAKWWLVEPREMDSQMMELMMKKLEGKMLTKASQKYLSEEPNLLQRMTKRYNSNNNNNNNNNSNNDNINNNNNNDQMTKMYISRMG